MARLAVLLLLMATVLRASAAPQGMGGAYLHYLNLGEGRTSHQRCDTVADNVGLMLRIHASNVTHVCIYPPLSVSYRMIKNT